jgi:hypothetical protein
MAVILSEPTGNVDVVNLALPPRRPVPMVLFHPPATGDRKATFPVGATGACDATVALRVSRRFEKIHEEDLIVRQVMMNLLMWFPSSVHTNDLGSLVCFRQTCMI